MIQSSLRTELKSDVTVITVAHRLQTIMDYDKIVRVPFPLYLHRSSVAHSAFSPFLPFFFLCVFRTRWSSMLDGLSSTIHRRRCWRRKAACCVLWWTRVLTRRHFMLWPRAKCNVRNLYMLVLVFSFSSLHPYASSESTCAVHLYTWW